jgi:hypothetical protein
VTGFESDLGAVLKEQNEHWQLESRHMLSLDSMADIPASPKALPDPDQESADIPKPTAHIE